MKRIDKQSIRLSGKRSRPKFSFPKHSISIASPKEENIIECLSLLDDILSSDRVKERSVENLIQAYERAFKVQSSSQAVPERTKIDSESELAFIAYRKNQSDSLESTGNRFCITMQSIFDKDFVDSERDFVPKIRAMTDSLGFRLDNFETNNLAICLSGGGAKGSFEAGSILYLERSGKLDKANLVAGTSVGAINALGLSSWGQNAGTQIGALWLALMRNSDMYRDSNQWNEIEALAEELDFNLDLGGSSSGGGSSGGGADFTGLDWATALSPFTLGISGIFGLRGARDKFEQIQELIEKLMNLDQVYTLKPTRNLLNDVLPKTIYAHIPLRMVFVSAVDGHPYFVDENAVARKMDTRHPREYTGSEYQVVGQSKRDALIRAAIASSSIPLIFGSERIWLNGGDGGLTYRELVEAFVEGRGGELRNVEPHLCWDGGVRDTLPLQAAIEAGSDEIIAISASTRDFNRNASFVSSGRIGAPDTLFRLIEVLTNEIAESDRLHSLEASKVSFIDPEITVHDFTEIDPGLIRINYEYGYMRAYNSLEKVPDAIANLLDVPVVGGLLYFAWIAAAYASTEEITALRKEIWLLENPSIHGYPVSYPSRGAAFLQSALAEIRAKKQRLFDLYKLRIDAWGTAECLPYPLPDGTVLSDSYLRWERRTEPFDSILRSANYPFQRQLVKSSVIGSTYWEDVGNVPAAPGPM